METQRAGLAEAQRTKLAETPQPQPVEGQRAGLAEAQRAEPAEGLQAGWWELLAAGVGWTPGSGLSWSMTC
ncbi:hypothetical protein [Actinokineospora sp. UTMC 2448]|uniref:hypothetical protein n=1 Tax=Actinokineospora sp. UTMC 2448 TaxID=2268449 RepID=UPI00216431A3|nr:hypothetical protein [Actinokineospora sp. UTMC 2448]UVS77582.1 hypothetical protein Actkin_01297 [Actinokineospora sp. UTMC 2448]